MVAAVAPTAESAANECPKAQRRAALQANVNLLRKLRMGLGLTLDRVAADNSLTFGYLSQIELNKGVPSLEVALRLTRYFGCTVEQAWSHLG